MQTRRNISKRLGHNDGITSAVLCLSKREAELLWLDLPWEARSNWDKRMVHVMLTGNKSMAISAMQAIQRAEDLGAKVQSLTMTEEAEA